MESNGGDNLINLRDPSCGYFHANINTVIKRHSEIRDTPYNRNVLCSKLITDLDFAAAEAVAELNFWNKYHHGNYRKVLSSYNGGFRGNPVYMKKALKARPYVKKIIEGR